jgi:hypothetical protein
MISCAGELGYGCFQVVSVNANCPSEAMPLRRLRTKGSHATPHAAILDVNGDIKTLDKLRSNLFRSIYFSENPK